MSNRGRARLLAVILVSGACSYGRQPGAGTGAIGPSTSSRASIHLLMFTTTAGFRHDSIPTARQAITNLGTTSGEFAVAATEDLSMLSPATLTGYDVIMFALT